MPEEREVVVIQYKILLTGKNSAIIDDFFKKMDDTFESQTTSMRFEDIISHLEYFNPSVFVYCLYKESRDNISRMGSVKQRLIGKNIPFVIVGDAEDCEEFAKISINAADLVLVKPLTANAIQERIVHYILEQKRIQEEEVERKLKEEVRRREEEQQKKLERERSRRKHILVVDDDVRMLKVIKEYLHEKYDVATAVNGKIALRFLENKKTDLILLDYEMPVEDGPAVLAKLRANNETKDLPVIFLTGITDKEKIKKVLVMKPQGYLLKPVEHDKLMDAIEGVLGGG